MAASDSSPLLESMVLLGRGDGSFGTPIVLGSDLAKAVGDFNGDGRTDLLVYPQTGNVFGFAVRFGNGDGTFQPAGPITALPSGGFTWAVVTDFNSDGKADVTQTTARVSNSNFVYVWLGNGDGTFGAAEMVPLPDVGGAHLALGDFNQDGNMDLAVSRNAGIAPPVGPPNGGSYDGAVVLLHGNGDGTFQKGVEYPVFHAKADSLIVADINQDGRPDVVQDFTVLLGNGGGTLQPSVAFGQFYKQNPSALAFSSPDASLVSVGDFNADGKPDLVGRAGDGTQISILINNTGGTDSSANAVSAADYGSAVVPNSIATIFGTELAATTAVATGQPLPTNLAGTQVGIIDQLGTQWVAELFYVSPTQINFLIPDIATGYAVFNVDNGKSLSAGARSTVVNSVAAGFFTADGSGRGPPAATAVRVNNDGIQTPVPVFECSSSSCVPVGIDLSEPGTVYLSLYGTGFRNARSDTCSGGSPSYVGPQGGFAGLDQLNVPLSKSLPSGVTGTQCGFTGPDGKYSVAAATIQLK